MLDWIKVVAGLVSLANAIIAWRKSAGDRMDGYTQAMAEGAAKTIEVTGISARTFGEAAGWTEKEVTDILTRPPAPSR